MQNAIGKELAAGVTRAATQAVKFLVAPASFEVSLLKPTLYKFAVYSGPRQFSDQMSYVTISDLDSAITLAVALLTKEVSFGVNITGHREYQFEVGAEHKQLLTPSPDLDRMDQDELCAWYEKNVGNNPIEDHPAMTLDELRANCKEMELIYRCEGLETDAYRLIEADRD
jgi:hypothetical protein